MGGVTPALEAPATVDEFLAGKDADAAALFRGFQELAEACGPSEVAVRRTIVYWKRERVFVGAFVVGRRLELNVDLVRTAEHPRLLSAFNTTKQVITHRLRIEEAAQLDDALSALVAEAYAEVGPGFRKGEQKPDI